jgi:hypothetical protein
VVERKVVGMLIEYGSRFFLAGLGSEPMVGFGFLKLPVSVPRLDPRRDRRLWYIWVGSMYTWKSLLVDGSELRMMDIELSMMLLKSVWNLDSAEGC